MRAYDQGWKSFVVFDVHGQRFIGNGFGPQGAGVQIDVYGSSGDYLASGLDGMQIVVHNDGQDQIGQIVKSGKIVIHGSVGQTLLYGAKGGEIFILGNAAGRPLINAVGRPRVVIKYPGGNLFSLASGGAIYARDPLRRLDDEQLNGGRYADLTDDDWHLILPYLQENERLFNILVERLLTVDGRRRTPQDVYGKIAPIELSVLK